MGLVANGIYGIRVFGGATALGSLPRNKKTFATNTLLWKGGANNARESVSWPAGYFTSAFYMPLKDLGLAAKLIGDGEMTVDSTLESFISWMDANLAGSGTVTNAYIAIGMNLLCLIEGAGTVTEASADLKIWMEALISIGASPSAFDIAQAVWGSVASQNNTSGTMGQKLNGAGSAGDPWTTDLSAYNTQGTAGKVLKDKLTKNQFLGLK